MFFWEICEIFKKTYVEEYLRTSASLYLSENMEEVNHFRQIFSSVPF